MAKAAEMVMRLTSELRLGSTEWNLEEYRALFLKLNGITKEGAITRYLRFSGEIAGHTELRFLGVETDFPGIPEGMTVLELSGDTLTVLHAVKGNPVIAWRDALKWDWLDSSVPGAPVGGFKARLPAGWTLKPNQLLVDFILTANAYFENGKYPDDDVRLAEYDPQWLVMYEEMAERLRKTIPPEILLRTEHFGSTAIPGMPAKPVIDILLDIPSFNEARRVLIPIFNKHEYEYWGYDDHILFVKRKEFMGARTHHIHAAPSSGRFWERIAFRDYLRTHHEDANRYAALKRELAGRHTTDREKYTIAKSEFVREITQKALRSTDK